MLNPWLALPSAPPFVLPSDSAVLKDFNRDVDDRHRVDLDELPEPYIGNPEALVVLLNLNPGSHPEGKEFRHGNPMFANLCRRNLVHDFGTRPFFFLDERLEGDRGRHWWERALRRPVEECGVDAVARGVFCAEFFPYHSRRYKNPQRVLESQAYTFDLVRKAVLRGAVVVVLRSGDRWAAAVPELVEYRQRFSLRNPRTVSLSPRNLGDEGFARVIAALGR